MYIKIYSYILIHDLEDFSYMELFSSDVSEKLL